MTWVGGGGEGEGVGGGGGGGGVSGGLRKCVFRHTADGCVCEENIQLVVGALGTYIDVHIGQRNK